MKNFVRTFNAESICEGNEDPRFVLRYFFEIKRFRPVFFSLDNQDDILVPENYAYFIVDVNNWGNPKRELGFCKKILDSTRNGEQLIITSGLEFLDEVSNFAKENHICLLSKPYSLRNIALHFKIRW